MTTYYNKTRKVAVRRKPSRGSYDRETIDAILDEGLVAHVGVVDDGQPFVIPVLYARRGEHLLLHGSPLSRLLGKAAAGVAMCLTVTLIDGIVFARSGFHHSMNYRSVVVLGHGTELRDPDEKRDALNTIIEHIAPGRTADARGPSPNEVKATEVVSLAIEEASAKVRTGQPVDAADDYALPVWAGELPLSLVAGEPRPDDRCSAPLPDYVLSYRRP